MNSVKTKGRQYRLAKRSGSEKAPFPRPPHILALVLIAIVGYGFYHFADHLRTESQMFQLREVKIEGNRYIEDQKIIKLADVQLGAKLYQIPIDSVTQKVLEYPYMEGVSVSRSLPSTLIISVQEREPVAYLIDNNIYMIDESGIVLLKKPAMSIENLPLVTGLSVKRILEDRQPLYDALDLIQKIQNVDRTLFQFISEIHMDEVDAPYLYLIQGGAKVEIGSQDIYKRLYLLSEFFKKPDVTRKLKEIKKIDVTYSDRIVVTRKS